MAGIRAGIDLPLRPAETFSLLSDELVSGLDRAGLAFQPGTEGSISEGGSEVGRVAKWQPESVIEFEWHPANWQPDLVMHILIRVEATDSGSRIVFEYPDWTRAFANTQEALGWFVGELMAQLFRISAPSAFGSWVTDRWARRPSGEQARATYRQPLYHYPSFKVILAELALTAEDYVLDVGCGGGAFLKEALLSGCRAAGIDYSPAMVQVAREVNREAIASGRLTIAKAEATQLPFETATFTSASMHGVLGFLSDPVAVLSEIRRVLRADGRMVILGTDPELKGTPACPEPAASRLQFYDDNALRRLGTDAGFREVTLLRRNLESLAREAGVPEEQLPMFAAHEARFLVARKQ